MVLIVFCHPDPQKKSHSHKILNEVEKTLNSRQKNYEILDLYQEDFDPVLSEEEYLRIKQRDHSTDKDVKRAQEKITQADTVVFIYPVWWYNMPARLKGFMDRVLTAGFAYNFFKTGRVMLFGAWLLSFIPGVRYLLQPMTTKGHLGNKRAFIFRTYGGPKLGKRVFRNTPTVLEEVTLRFCGLTKITIHELFNCDKGSYTQEYENWYLKKTAEISQKM